MLITIFDWLKLMVRLLAQSWGDELLALWLEQIFRVFKSILVDSDCLMVEAFLIRNYVFMLC